MTAKIITFGISKGGCSKSTTSGITAWLLSEKKRVLCIDMDCQGNLTSFLTGEYDICNVFEEKTILEAIREAN
ncbi:ParA family protein, partial [Bacillus cereus]|uniref:ParA family protein n=1 Tax=Bacillus cereus TaxID=1396 RepID=UPI00366A7AE8